VEDSVSSISVSAIVVTYNEDERLEACLESVACCDELIVADLRSQDRSVEIAKAHDACLIHHERLPVVEQVRASVIDEAEHNWVLFLDPDEVLCPDLLSRADRQIEEGTDVGRVFLPWKFYFRGRPLEGTQWGGQKHKGVLIHRERCRLHGDVHRGIELKEGCKSVRLSWSDPECCIRHYWIDSFGQLFEKHRRYLREEGEAKFNQGHRFTLKKLLLGPLRSFKRSFLDLQGWRDGWTGLFLSLFHAWYVWKSLLSLRRYQKTHASSKH